MVIDKDRNPKWHPNTLEEIDDNSLDEYMVHRDHYADLVLQDESVKENCEESVQGMMVE